MSRHAIKLLVLVPLVVVCRGPLRSLAQEGPLLPGLSSAPSDAPTIVTPREEPPQPVPSRGLPRWLVPTGDERDAPPSLPTGNSTADESLGNARDGKDVGQGRGVVKSDAAVRAGEAARKGQMIRRRPASPGGPAATVPPQRAAGSKGSVKLRRAPTGVAPQSRPAANVRTAPATGQRARQGVVNAPRNPWDHGVVPRGKAAAVPTRRPTRSPAVSSPGAGASGQRAGTPSPQRPTTVSKTRVPVTPGASTRAEREAPATRVPATRPAANAARQPRAGGKSGAGTAPSLGIGWTQPLGALAGDLAVSFRFARRPT